MRAAEWMRRTALAVASMLMLSATHTALAAEPLDVVRGAADAILAELKANPDKYRASDAALHGLVREKLLPYVDQERVAQWILGRNYRSASEAQRGRFIEAFTGLLLRTYATALREYDSQEIRYLPSGAGEGDTAVVRTQVVRPDGPPVAVDYKLTSRSGSWRVYDVAIENVSMVVTYRAEYAAIIQREGLDGLIARLEQRAGVAAPAGSR
jgi:phospholipid transport system substrate-binding protein